MYKLKYISFALSFLFFISCEKDNFSPIDKSVSKFELLDSSQTGIGFTNELKFDRDFNIYTYRNFYNGGGVSIGDINNDGLPDVFMTANMGSNELYLNKGDLKFEKITESAGVGGNQQWSTGTTMIDVNNDGFLDIYVCNSGDIKGDSKQNELFINNGNNTFTEQAEEFGLADKGYSTHAVFFDYDKDNDLDAYLLNNSYQAIGSFNLTQKVRGNRDDVGGDKLLRNDNGVFVDVSEEAGIYGSVIGFGLGVTVGDINNDNWDDIYISNDFFEKDYLYINNQDGTFSETMESYMKSISVASMGADLADINNDGLPDIFVTEMLPSTDRRLKTKTTFEDWDKYQSNLKNGYYHQFTRNMLHINQPNERFVEVGRMCGVEATDWSWGALMVDLDNDGLKDIFVANGIYQDLTDQDFINFIADSDVMASMVKENKVDYQKLIDAIPSERIPNHFFKNNGNLNFSDATEDFGFGMPSHSNGSAYGDLDLDGDLDLIINNVNMPTFVYENKSSDHTHFLQFKLNYKSGNREGIGSKVSIHSKGNAQHVSYMPMKGFQSSMDHLIHFGLGSGTNIDSVRIVWPDSKVSTLYNPSIDTLLTIDYSKSSKLPLKTSDNTSMPKLFKNVTELNVKHEENTYVDFDRDRLLFHMTSTLGPDVAVADINNDGLDDILLTQAKGKASQLFYQNKAGEFVENAKVNFSKDIGNEDVRAVVFDVNNDNKKDIFFLSASSELSQESSDIKDRLYINSANGNFDLYNKALGFSKFQNTAALDYADIDNDGDMDLVVAEKLKPSQFGVPCSAYVLRNDGDAGFKNITKENAPELLGKGMYSDIKFADINNDSYPDIVYVGQYLGLTVLLNDGQNSWREDKSLLADLPLKGWWNTLEVRDLNGDGLMDIVAGNHGTNSRFKASPDKPLCLHINDFDKNGSIEQILCRYEGDKSYPLALRHDIFKQLPHLKKKYLKYENYANQTIEDIFSEEERQNMLSLTADNMKTVVLINEGSKFRSLDLPKEVQFSPVHAILMYDFNGDGKLDILMGGNFDDVKPEVGRYDASQGFLLLANASGTYDYTSNHISGFEVEGEVRDLEIIEISSKPHVLVARNNDTCLLYEFD